MPTSSGGRSLARSSSSSPRVKSKALGSPPRQSRFRVAASRISQPGASFVARSYHSPVVGSWTLTKPKWRLHFVAAPLRDEPERGGLRGAPLPDVRNDRRRREFRRFSRKRVCTVRTVRTVRRRRIRLTYAVFVLRRDRLTIVSTDGPIVSTVREQRRLFVTCATSDGLRRSSDGLLRRPDSQNPVYLCGFLPSSDDLTVLTMPYLLP
jgi:hypothetical protein